MQTATGDKTLQSKKGSDIRSYNMSEDNSPLLPLLPLLRVHCVAGVIPAEVSAGAGAFRVRAVLVFKSLVKKKQPPVHASDPCTHFPKNAARRSYWRWPPSPPTATSRSGLGWRADGRTRQSTLPAPGGQEQARENIFVTLCAALRCTFHL